MPTPDTAGAPHRAVLHGLPYTLAAVGTWRFCQGRLLPLIAAVRAAGLAEAGTAKQKDLWKRVNQPRGYASLQPAREAEAGWPEVLEAGPQAHLLWVRDDALDLYDGLPG